MKSNLERVGLPPFEELNRTVLDQLLNTQQPFLPFAARAVLRTQLGLPAESAATNAPPAAITNVVENVPTNSAAK